LVDETGRRDCGLVQHTRRIEVTIVERGIARRQRQEIGAGTPHDRLVVIVADGVEIRHLLEVRSISGIHVEEAHCQAPLEGVIGGRAKAVIVVADPRGLRDPYKQMLFVAVTHLLPYLEEAMYRIAGEITVSHVARELVVEIRHLSPPPRPQGQSVGIERPHSDASVLKTID
jgi:hypothetical protein